MERRGVAHPEGAECQFCKIASGVSPCHSVFEDGSSLAFLDHRPLFPGHCLLVPRAHYPTLLDLPTELIPAIFLTARLLAKAVEAAMKAEGTFVAINNRVSQSVPHFHIHVVPRRKKDGLRGFFWPRQRYRDEEDMCNTQEAVRSAIARLRS
ncbi:MAG: HIT family protein [Acidobacteria bacterium]|nr:HIT family protein [Acidobacteriota bacterium]